MPDTKHVTDEMVEAGLSEWLKNWRELDESTKGVWRDDMRAALTAALALMPTGDGFRAGAEWAAGIASKVTSDQGDGDDEWCEGYAGGRTDSVSAIRTALAALPADPVTAMFDARSAAIGDDISVSLAVDLVSAQDEIRALKVRLAALPEGGDGTRTLTADQVEALDGAAEEIMGSANYLKDRLDRGLEVYESMWLDGLMEVHGTLLGIADGPPRAAPQTRDAGGET